MNYTKCWLEYPEICNQAGRRIALRTAFSGPVAKRTEEELALGLAGLYQAELCPALPGVQAELTLEEDGGVHAEGYAASAAGGHCTIRSGSAVGALYGVFALLRQLQMEGCAWEELTWQEEKRPSNDLRMLNHWDNLDGSIERGYSGESFFYKDDEIIEDWQRITDYARMVASVGLNGVVINNVNVKNAATWLITDRYFRPLRRYLDIFASFGIKMYLCVNFAATIELGGLDTADPCDSQVAQWWSETAKTVWDNLPGLGGFMVKADSEGRPGPFTYGRNQADGANMLADAVAPFGGRIIWRCFVYNCKQDWRDIKTDRAKAGYDYFMPLDGTFRDNVTLQIKNGPMDFQVREPVSPLIGGLKHTKFTVEFQIAQEYTGQQRHVCYLMPWFRQVLETDLHTGGTVAQLISGAGFGMAAVTNTGDDANWTGHDLAAANLYGFGRLSYDTALDGEAIAREWLRLTFGQNPRVESTLLEILMASWPTYEKYNAPLGVGWMVNPNHHYGPNVDGYEYSSWGCYVRACYDGVGIDRTHSGSDYVSQYAPELAEQYNNPETCPEELLLFFHHMPYSYVLKSGKTVLQHIYDTHFEGAEDAARFYDMVVSLKPDLKPEVYERLEARFAHQKEHACEWRDVINTYFYRKTGIGDEKGRKIYE
ncbi:MAG: alpha-glucuronidase [Candidatus Onthomonas sp.]